MKTKQQQMIATLLKEGRLTKGYTQKELSELSNISVRSIQRIENGEILPRSYTLKTLAEILGLSFDSLLQTQPELKRIYKANKGQKIILSTGISLFILLLAGAFVAQSPTFPETNFEMLIYSALILLAITILLIIIWRTRT